MHVGEFAGATDREHRQFDVETNFIRPVQIGPAGHDRHCAHVVQHFWPAAPHGLGRSGMRVPWQSALLGKFVSEIAALLVEFLCRMLDFQARLVGNADLHTPDQIAVALPVGHAPCRRCALRCRWTSLPAL